MSQFPVITEKAHSAEFILSESLGHQSRDNAYFADPTTIRVGQPCKQTAAATTDKPATYTVATVGADCQAIAIYGGTSVPTDGLRIAVISRNAEVNGRLIDWGAMSTAEQVAGVAALAAKNIMARF